MGCSMTVNPEMTWLPIVENLEVLFREVAHCFPLAIAHYNRHEYFIYVGFDRGTRRGRFLLLSCQ